MTESVSTLSAVLGITATGPAAVIAAVPAASAPVSAVVSPIRTVLSTAPAPVSAVLGIRQGTGGAATVLGIQGTHAPAVSAIHSVAAGVQLPSTGLGGMSHPQHNSHVNFLLLISLFALLQVCATTVIQYITGHRREVEADGICAWRIGS